MRRTDHAATAEAPAPTTRSRRRPDHLPALDGLRGIAVCAVVAYHLDRLPGGFVGVDVFFVLSGFLITRLLLAERTNHRRISLRGFWARRVRRLFPAMALTAVLVMVLGRQLLESSRLRDLRIDALSALGFIANWRFIDSGQSYFEATSLPSPLRHTWSLAVEEQFYLVWPLFFLAAITIARRHRRVGVAVMAGLVAAISATSLTLRAGPTADLSRLYYGTDSRIFAMAIGGVIATFFDPLRRHLRRRGVAATLPIASLGFLGLTAVIAGFIAADDQGLWMYRWGFLSIAGATGLLLVSLTADRGPLGPVLSWRPLCWIGERSYGIYLFSWPTQIFAEHRFLGSAGPIRDLGVVVVSLVVAALSFTLLERPIIDSRPPWHRWRGNPTAVRRSGRVRTPFALSVIAAIAVFALSFDAEPKREFVTIDEDEAVEEALRPSGFGDDDPVLSPKSESTTSTTRPATAPIETIEPGDDPPFDPDEPIRVEPVDIDPRSIFGRPLRILMIGDSAPMTLGPVDPFGDELGIEVQNRSFMGCGLVPHGWAFEMPEREDRFYPDRCVHQPKAQETGLEAGPDVVMLWVGAWDVFDQRRPDGTLFRNGSDAYGFLVRTWLQERIDRNRSVGVATVLVEVPCFGTRDGELRTLEAVDWFNDQVRMVANSNPGWVRTIQPEKALCRDGKPDVENADGDPVRPDGLHFDEAGREWLWRTWLADAIASSFS